MDRRDDWVAGPRLQVVLPEELLEMLDGPFVPLDLDAFEHWAKTGEGDPWRDGA